MGSYAAFLQNQYDSLKKAYESLKEERDNLLQRSTMTTAERKKKLEAIYVSIDHEPDDWFKTYCQRVRDEIGPFKYIHYRHSTEGTVGLKAALSKVADVLTDPGFSDAGGEEYLFAFHESFAGEPIPDLF